jgi:peptidoglycan-associated lipoprotein
MKYIALFSVLTIFFIGCGEPTPVPTLSQNDVVNEERELQNLENNSTENLETIPLNRDDIVTEPVNMRGVDDENGTLPISSSPETSLVAPSQPLAQDDTDAISSQFESIYFKFDRYSIEEDLLQVLKRNVTLMNSENLSGRRVIIEGNCDEWGTDEYNYALGLKRAQSIKEAMIVEGVNEERIRTVSYGESNPICLEQLDKCWAKNRRVDFKVAE